MNTAPSIQDRRLLFRKMHETGCFVLPNPFDLGSARYLESLGFKALASSSAGLAWALGAPDNHIKLDQVLSHLADLVQGTSVPINADFENGFGLLDHQLADCVKQAVHTGVAALSIEDGIGDSSQGLYSITEATHRVSVARQAIDQIDSSTMLVARAECYLHGHQNLDDVIARLKAYVNVGADVVYAPGLRDPAEISRLVDELAPTPVNLLIGWSSPIDLQTASALGVRRISVGSAMAKVAWQAFAQSAKDIANFGRFDSLDAVKHIASSELNSVFSNYQSER
jgi:2-methylisocitrate lyase-like PEP mutase family enzyme